MNDIPYLPLIRAQRDLRAADAEKADAAARLNEAQARLADLPNILERDRAERKLERQEVRRQVLADSVRNAARRERELDEARKERIEAEEALAEAMRDANP